MENDSYLDGNRIPVDKKALAEYVGKKIMSVHRSDVDSYRGQARPRSIIIEEIRGNNLFLANGDTTWIPDYLEFAEMPAKENDDE